MDRKILLWIVIGVMLIATIYLTFKTGTSSTAVSTGQATVQATQSAASYGGMVGGC